MSLREHLNESARSLVSLEAEIDHLASIGERLGNLLLGGGRLLVCGNGGSAAEAQHFTAELVGRYCDDRRPLSALALHAETSTLTAVSNDYGAEAAFSRQVIAHGRSGDALLTLSTSGRSPNILEALRAGRDCGLWTIALGGTGATPMIELADDPVIIAGVAPFAVQEAHLIAIHMLSEAVDDVVRRADATKATFQ